MAVDILLKIADVVGESVIDGHEDEIDVVNWNWGLSQSGSMHVGGGGGAGKADIGDIMISKYVDKSTPDIIRACCNGTHFSEATLLVRKAGKDPLDYMRITMTKVMVTSYSTDGAAGGDALMENVSLNFAKMEIGYTPQTDNGTGDAEVTLIWDVEKNMEE